jgi:hypothetical protein
MKKEFKINHDAETLSEAIGITNEELTRITHDIVVSYASNPSYDRVSHLAQLVHERMPYEMLIMMGTRQVREMMDDFERMMHATKDILKGFNEDED